MSRVGEVTRKTSETEVSVKIAVDGTGTSSIETGLGFLDHMVASFARHSRFDITLAASGDTQVDDHHTVEDCAIVLGRSLAEALGDRAGINRFGYAYAPLDESLARAVVDLSGRPWAEVSVSFTRDMIGDVATENLAHFWRSFAIEARMALHLDLLRGENDHHKAESAFKALALALREATGVSGDAVPSTKGTLV